MTSRQRSLGHISRHFDVKDWVNALANVRMANDWEAAILGTSMVDRGLEVALLSKFVGLSKRQIEAIFEGTGPLVSFSAKIKIAHAMGVIGGHVKDDLDKIRNVRNVFAHSILDVSFETKEISAVCAQISFPTNVNKISPGIDIHWEIETPKGKFLMAVFLYAALFITGLRESPPDALPDRPDK